MKKLLALLLAAVMVLGLAACGSAQAADSGEKTLKVALVVPNKPKTNKKKDGTITVQIKTKGLKR